MAPEFYAVAYSSLPLNADQNQPAPVTALSMSMWVTGVAGTFNTLSLGLYGEVPSQQTTAWVYLDANGNAINDGGDVLIASNTFTGAAPATAFLPINLALALGATQRLFLNVSWQDYPIGRRFRVGFDQDWQVSYNLPGQLPQMSTEAVVRARVYAAPNNANQPYPDPRINPVGGGQDTGLYLHAGQTLTVGAAGTWGAGSGPVNADGGAPTGGLNPGFNRGALVGRVGGGNWLLLGQSSTQTVVQSGPLYLAANDTNYLDNSGFLDANIQIQPSTAPKVWVGGTLGFENSASVDQNWLGGRPHRGERAHFTASSAYDCDWDIPYEEIYELRMSSSYGRVLTLRPQNGFNSNELRVSSMVVVTTATLRLGFQTLRVDGPVTIGYGGTLDFGNGVPGAVGYSQLYLGDSLTLSSGSFLTARGNNGSLNAANPNDAWRFKILGATVAVDAGLFVYGFDQMTLTPGHLDAFDGLYLNAAAVSTGPLIILNSTGAVSWTFRDWDMYGGQTGSTGVWAAGTAPGSIATFVSAAGSRAGSPNSFDPNGVLQWNPDVGGASASVGGSLNCVGCANPTDFVVRLTTDPRGGFVDRSFTQAVVYSGVAAAYSFPAVTAPTTYYLFAFQGFPRPYPDMQSARGGFGHDGYFRSETLFVAPGASLTGQNVNAAVWGAAAPYATVNSTQTGPIRFETWEGPHHVPTSTRTAGGSNFVPFDVKAGTPDVFGFVDMNNDGFWQTFESSGGATAVSITAGSTATPSFPIAGGAAAPGGTLTLSTQALAVPAIGPYDSTPLLRLSLAAAGGPGAVSALRVFYFGQQPLSSATYAFEAYEDSNGNGVYDPLVYSYQSGFTGDRYLGTASAGPSLNASSATISFFSPVQAPNGGSRGLFVALNMYGSFVSTAGISIQSADDFGVAAGQMAVQPGIYPASSVGAPVRPKISALMPAYAYGGYAGGEQVRSVFAGQSLTAFASTGAWSADPSQPFSGAQGVPGTQGGQTVLPSARLGELIGVVQGFTGNFHSPWFRIGGATLPVTIPMDGNLRVAINDFEGNYGNNAGALLVDFSISGTTLGALSGQILYSTPTSGVVTIQAKRSGVLEGAVGVSVTLVSTAFPFFMPNLRPGEYTLEASHDVVSDFGLSGKSVSLAAGTTATLDLTMFQGTGTITGSLTYSGVLNYGLFHIGVTTSPTLEDGSFFGGSTIAAPGAWTAAGLPAPATYFVVAFRDGNINNNPDGAEPLGYYGTPGGSLSSLASYLTPIYVTTGATVPGITLAPQDMGAISGPAFLPPAPTGRVVVQAGRGRFGAAGYAVENKVELPIPASLPAGVPMPYQLGLLAPATDYSVFAFHDINTNGVVDSGEGAFQTFPVAASRGAQTNLSLTLTAPVIPPTPTGFKATSGAGQVFFSWDRSPGATAYFLLNGSGSPLLSLTDPTSVYLDALAANTATQIRQVVAKNANGTSAAAVLAPAYSFAATPTALSTSAVNQVSATLSWTGGNPAGTVYELWRGTGTNGASVLASSGTTTSRVETGLAPGGTYYWRVAALNGNGIASAFSSQASTVTLVATAPSIAGLLSYAGAQPGRLVVEASASPTFSPLVSSAAFPSLAVQAYYLPVPASASYHVRAFVDLFGDGVRRTFADTGLNPGNPVTVGVGPLAGSNFTVAVDTIAPGTPAGVAAAPSVGQVTVRWAAPTRSADGSALPDLRAFAVERSTALGSAFASIGLVSSSTLVFVDTVPAAGFSNFYRVIARDWGGNSSAPSGVVTAAPSAGGSVSGVIRNFSPSTGGQFRVRLSTSPERNANAVADISLTSYTFSGLSDGVYYLRAHRDLTADGVENPAVEPGGTFGGLNTPHPIQIVGGNAVTGADATVCDRLQFPTASSFTINSLLAVDCPALDKGEGFTTKLYALRVGGGAVGSIGVGTQVRLTMKSTYANEIIVLAPNGAIAVRDNRVGGAVATFTASATGVYLVEPTSFDGGFGSFELGLRLEGGFAGVLSGSATYTGGQSGLIAVQLYNSAAADATAIAVATRATPGPYSFPGLPDGTYFLRGYRDSVVNGVRDPGEPSGVFGPSLSSPTPVAVFGGSPIPSAPHDVVLVDPATGVVRGAVLYNGSQSGPIRVQFGPPACPQCFDMGAPLATVSTGTQNSYQFALVSPATNYVVRAFVDTNGNGRPDTLETSGSSAPVTVFANAITTVSFILNDAGGGGQGSAVLVGTVSYAGASTGAIFVGFSHDQQFRFVDYVLQLPATGYFRRSGVYGGSSYYMAAFVDANGSGNPDNDLGEPFGVGAPFGFPGQPTLLNPPFIYVALTGETSTQVTILDAPDGSIQGVVTYAGAAPTSQKLIIEAYRAGSQMGMPTREIVTRQSGVSNYPYSIDLLPAASFFVSAFVDSNANERYDYGEPSGGAGPALMISSGAGSFPAYGTDFSLQDAGSFGGAAAAGRITGDISYLGVQGGPVFVRAFGNSSFQGLPLYSQRITGPSGAGQFAFDLQNLPFGSYWIDAFRDPADTGVYNPTFHARGVLNRGDAVTVDQYNSARRVWGGDVTDPGQGGSVNAFTGSFAALGGVRFNGGATDIGVVVVVDTITAGSPKPVLMGISAQNSGIAGVVARFDANGVMTSSGTPFSSTDNAFRIALDAAGLVYIPDRIQAVFPAYNSTATLTRYGPSMQPQLSAQMGVSEISELNYSSVTNRLYAGARLPNSSTYGVLTIRPTDFVAESTRTFTPSVSCSNGCDNRLLSMATSIDGATSYLMVGTGPQGGALVQQLLRFNAGATPSLVKDVTALGFDGQDGAQLAVDLAGNLYMVGVPKNAASVATYRFDADLIQVASTTFGPVLLHFEGGMGNVQVDSTDGHLYQTWETTGTGGDITVLRYSPSLSLLVRRDFDGGAGAKEDFPFSLAIYNSSTVFVAGAVNNGADLDWTLSRFNMNATGAASAAGTGVTITTSNATNYLFGSLSYAGSLASSGTFRTVLLPLGDNVPIRLATAPFGATAPLLYNNAPYAPYELRSFLDLNNNLAAEAGEPIAYGPPTFQYVQGSSLTLGTIALCDRRELPAGTLNDALVATDCSAPQRPGARLRLYTFRGTRGQPVTLDMIAVGFYDSFLELFGPDGRRLRFDDESAGNGNARIANLILPEDGLYTVAAAAYAPNTIGAFKLSLTGSSGSLGSIAGTVDYQGTQGGQIGVGLFSAPQFSSVTALGGLVLTSTRAFRFSSLPSGTTYYLGAYIDVNYNARPDAGEDSGVFGGAGVPSPIYLQPGQNAGGLTVLVAASTTSAASAGYITGVASYSGARTGQFILEFWPSALFTGRPVASRVVPTGVGSFDVSVPGGQSYFVRAFIDANSDFALNPDEPRGVYAPNAQGAEPLFVPVADVVVGASLVIKDQGLTAGGVYAGEGSATLTPSTAAAQTPSTLLITYTAGPNGIATGGKVGFTAPPGFPFPTVSGASVTANAPTALSSVFYAGPSAFVSVVGPTLTNGQQLTLQWNGVYLPCQVGPSTITVVSVQYSTATPLPLLTGSPVLTVVPGPQSRFEPREPYFTTRAGSFSDERVLEARDMCGNRVAAVSGTTVTVRSVMFNGSINVPDPLLGVSTGTALSTAAAVNVLFEAGVSSRSFYALATSTGFKNYELFFNLGQPTTFQFGLSAVPANALTAVSVSSSPTGQALSTATIALGASGLPNQVFVNFTLGDAQQGWRILFSSVPFKSGVPPTPVWERWGFGQPQLNSVSWDGRDDGRVGGVRVPNGLYYGRVELGGGGVRDESLRVTVSLPQFAGVAYDAGVFPYPPLAGASVRVYGPAGFFTATADEAGRYVLPGLGAGNYNFQAARDGYVNGAADMTLNSAGQATAFTARTTGLTVSSNATGGLDAYLARAPRLVILPSVDVSVSTEPFDRWGNLQVQASTASAAQSQTLYGPMRLPAGTTTFDDGGQWDSATASFVYSTLLKFNLPVGSYTVVADMTGLTRSTAAVYLGPDGARVNLTPFQRKATIAGTVTLPTIRAFDTPISVSAVPLSTAATALGGFGGATVLAGQTVGNYLIGGLDAGTYILRANAQGVSAASSGPITVAANQNLTGVNFPVFGAGANISGTVTTTPAAPLNTPVYLNAWAPGSLNFGSTVVYTNAGGSAGYALPGLDAGATYQLYAHVDTSSEYDRVGGFPVLVNPTATVNLSMEQSSGVISGTIFLPAGSTDFLSVDLNGVTIASLRPAEVGSAFSQPDATTLPGFICGNGAGPTGGYCPLTIDVASFTVTGLNTQTLDLTFFYKRTGQTSKSRVSVVNGLTTPVVVDLTGATFSISGSVNNQITHQSFNTNAKIVANAPFVAPPGWPATLSSSTARVVAVRQEIDDYGVAISTVFDPATSRVGFLDAFGDFSIPNVPNGVYLVRSRELALCATCEAVVPSAKKLVNVSGAAVSSVTLTLSDGYGVSGTLSLDGGLQDSRVFELSIRNRRQEVVRSTVVYLGDAGLGVTANAASFSFASLPAGDFYTLVVRDAQNPAKYAGRPASFPDPALSPSGLQSSQTGVSVVLQRAAFLIGRVKDAGTGEVISKDTAGLLAPNFGITAKANPWVEGGFVAALSSAAGRPIDFDGYFRVGPLLPGVSYDLRLAQTSWDPSFLAAGSQNYAPVTIGGLKPSAGEIRDVGVISLSQGQSLTGVVRATATLAALGNLKVIARPSFGGDDSVTVQTYTDASGRYSLWVSSSLSNQFDVTAAPREANVAGNGVAYEQSTLLAVSLLSGATANFVLRPLPVAVTGQVVVADAGSGGALSYPFGDKRGFPAAAVNLQPVGVVPENPLGDIEATTDQSGLFRVFMATGIYNLHAASLGYSVFNATVAVTGAGFRIFTGSNTPSNDLPGSVITLARGASITGRIVKSDGSAPSTEEIKGVAAANFGQGEFVIGSIEADQTAKTVNSYSISGFKVGVSYDIVLITGEGSAKDVAFPAEGDDVTFSSAESTTTKSITLTFKPSRPNCLASAKALDAARTRFLIEAECLKPLRAETAADEDLAGILRVSTFTAAGAALVSPNGTGAFEAGSRAIDADRRRLTGVYATQAGEQRFSVRLTAAFSTVNPETGLNFTIDRAFDFYAGLDSAADGRVTNINGGSVALQPSAEDESLGLDERARLSIPAGAFAEGSDSTADNLVVANPTTTVNVTMTKGRDQQLARTLSMAARGYAPVAYMTADSPSSYPAETWAAMSAYRAMASTSTVGGANPLSSFYSIFLPAGIRHQLKERADLTLSYTLAASTSTTDDKIQVWFYNAVLGRFVLESTDRRLDTVNKTITVSVDHFSTFVVLDSTPVATSTITFAGPEIVVANFPNPADCITHSGIARNSILFGSGGAHAPFMGTMIRASLPQGNSAPLKIHIYNVAGEKVRTIGQGDVPGGQTYYSPWNCANEDGRTVSSGVYIGEVVWGSLRRFFKIAIIKGSGL